MEIILREHIDNLGRRGDVVKVANIDSMGHFNGARRIAG